MKIVVNLRNLTGGLTGVQRYTQSVLERLSDRLDSIAPKRPSQGIRGHLWEQFTLPVHLRGRLLWSPGNTGPISIRRQVVTIHDVSTLDHPEWFSRSFAIWYRRMLPLLVRSVNRVIVVSEFSKTRLLARTRVAPEKVTVIHNGIDCRFVPSTDLAISAVRSKFGLVRPYVLFVGSLEPRKNISVLIKAWQQLRLADCDLAIAGVSGAIFRDRGFEAQVPPATLLLGHVDDVDLPALYSGAACFVYPSLYEGFGLPALEAMACGCPAIVTSATSLPEVCGEAAVYVDPRCPEDWAARIQEMCLLNDSSRSHVVEAGLKRAATFSWETCAAQTLQVLESEASK